MRLPLSIILLTIVELQVAHAETLNLPPRRAGLWEMTTTVGADETTMWQCISETVGQFPPQTLDDMTFCERKNLKKTVEGLKAKLECKTDKIHVVASANVTGNFKDNMRIETKGYTIVLATGNVINQTSSIVALRWISSCKPDQSPGDLIFPNGKTINLFKTNK
jgi:hypothetical protein